MANQKRFWWTLRICVSAILLSGAGSALAQTDGLARESGKERLLRSLTGESDAAFERLMDRCILDHGRRICPGEDSEAGTTGDADIPPGPPPERAVTWVPGVRGELNEHLVLEDRIRERLDSGEAAGAVEDAQRLLAIAESGRGAGLLTALELYGDALTDGGRYNEAETQYERALMLKLPENDAGGITRLMGSGTDLLLGKLANVHAVQGQLPQALKLSERAVRLAGDGKLDPNGAWVFYNHARIAARAGNTNEAERYFRRGAELFLAFYGDGSRDAAYGFDALGRMARDENNSPEAVAQFRRAAEIERHALNTGRSSQNSEPDAGGVYVFLDLVTSEYGLAAQQPEQRSALLGEAFEAAQWASQKTTAAALSQMAARQAKGAGPLAELLRHQQDLVTKWRQTSTQLAGALLASSNSDGAEGPKALRSRLYDEEREIRQTDERLAAEFPDYFALMKPVPLSLDQVRRLLGEDEALVLFTFTESDLFIWTVSREGASWRKAELSAAEIAREVQALRCGLDINAWSSRVSPCFALLGRTYTEEDALRRAEVALIAKSGRFARPSVWAPFVLVGNGEQ
jgi:tetratricopeptide (TPR) repeat protein